MWGKRYACHDVRRRVSEGPPVSPTLHAALGPRSRASKGSRGIPTITAELKPACRRKVGARNLFRPHMRTSPPARWIGGDWVAHSFELRHYGSTPSHSWLSVCS